MTNLPFFFIDLSYRRTNFVPVILIPIGNSGTNNEKLAISGNWRHHRAITGT